MTVPPGFTKPGQSVKIDTRRLKSNRQSVWQKTRNRTKNQKQLLSSIGNPTLQASQATNPREKNRALSLNGRQKVRRPTKQPPLQSLPNSLRSRVNPKPMHRSLRRRPLNPRSRRKQRKLIPGSPKLLPGRRAQRSRPDLPRRLMRKPLRNRTAQPKRRNEKRPKSLRANRLPLKKLPTPQVRQRPGATAKNRLPRVRPFVDRHSDVSPHGRHRLPSGVQVEPAVTCRPPNSKHAPNAPTADLCLRNSEALDQAALTVPVRVGLHAGEPEAAHHREDLLQRVANRVAGSS